MTASLLDAALAPAERGWPVFPLVPGRKAPRRSAADWERRATVDPARIGRWWAAHPRDNVGIATGPAGLVVVDLDVARRGEKAPDRWRGAGGADVLAALAAEHGERMPATFTVTTPSGGRHLYFERPAGPELRSTAGRLGWHIDTRAAGGYVVAAGSTVAGRRYAVCDESPPVPLPPWIERLLAPPPTAGAAPPARRLSAPPSRRRGYVAAALDGEVRRVLDAGPHTRNQALNKAAWNLGRYVAAGVLPRHVVEDALCAAGEAAGYRDGPRAVAAVVRNALDARINRHPASSTTAPEAQP